MLQQPSHVPAQLLCEVLHEPVCGRMQLFTQLQCVQENAQRSRGEGGKDSHGLREREEKGSEWGWAGGSCWWGERALEPAGSWRQVVEGARELGGTHLQRCQYALPKVFYRVDGP